MTLDVRITMSHRRTMRTAGTGTTLELRFRQLVTGPTILRRKIEEGATMKKRKFAEPADAKCLEEEIRIAADQARFAIQRLVEQSDALHVLEAVKFDKVGRDPLDPTRPLNLIEQVNQTFTALVSVRAVQHLFDHHPEAAPFLANLGTAAGFDIESCDGSVVAEVFSATHPASNQKLKKDIAKVGRSPAKHRYVFFLLSR